MMSANHSLRLLVDAGTQGHDKSNFDHNGNAQLQKGILGVLLLLTAAV
jgi:hypothetical protein